MPAWKESCSRGTSRSGTFDVRLKSKGTCSPDEKGERMRSKRAWLLVTGIAVLAIGISAESGFSNERLPQRSGSGRKTDPASTAIAKAINWLVAVQGRNGGWGQDGGETSYVRQGERLESRGND